MSDQESQLIAFNIPIKIDSLNWEQVELAKETALLVEEDLELEDGEAPELPQKLTKAGLEKEDGLKEKYKTEGPEELRMASSLPSTLTLTRPSILPPSC